MAANGYQKHILIGNLGADPQVTTFKNGSSVVNFDIAINEENRDGTKVVTWYGITAWNGLGEACAQYLKKGRQVMVEGTRLRVEHWFGRDNNLYTKLELTANEVKFLGGNGNGNGNGNGYGNGNGNGYGNGNGSGSGNGQYTRQRQRTNTSQRTSQPQRQPAPHTSQPEAESWDYEQIADEVPF